MFSAWSILKIQVFIIGLVRNIKIETMNKEGHNKFWELATGKIHEENNLAENRQLEELMKRTWNKNSFKQLQNIHDRLYKIKPLKEFSRGRSWGMINGYLREKRIHMVLSIGKYAAILLVAFLVGNLLRPLWDLSFEPESMAEISVPLGQMSELTLYDGTHVWLNSGTTLKYESNFGKKDRNVVLDGEAFFKVKHGKSPFRVKLKNSEIEVLGTSFNAVSYASEKNSYVTLVEGSVRINTLSGKKITTITPSEQAVIPENLQNIKVNQVDADFYYGWTEGKIIFDEERLADVALRLERWYNVEIRLEGKGTGDLRFSGTILKNKPFDQIVRTFQLLLPVKVNYQHSLQDKDVITISKQDMPMD